LLNSIENKNNILTEDIKKILTFSDSDNILLLGMGNDFRSDDGIGIYIVEHLNPLSSNVVIINLRNTPEMFLDDIVQSKPNKTILFDAANFEGVPGEIKYIPQEYINNYTLSTHTFPPGVIAELIKADTDSEVYFIGIQAENFDLGEEISPSVQKSGDTLIKFINKEIKKCMN